MTALDAAAPDRRLQRQRVARALGRLAAGTASAAVLVTGALLTREWWGPAEDTLGFGWVVIPLFWGLAGMLLQYLVVPAWRGDRWRRRALGVCGLAGCTWARHWLSYEPEPGTGSYAVGVAVAVLLGVTAAAAVLAEAVTARLQRVVAAASAVALALVVAWTLGAFPTETERYTADWYPPDPGGPSSEGVPRQVTDQVRSHVAPERCGGASVVVLRLGWPLGTSLDSARPQASRVYVRDPEAALPPEVQATLAGPLDTDSEIPSIGVDTGYRSGDVQLLLGPDDGEQHVYVVRGRGVERWPRALDASVCPAG